MTNFSKIALLAIIGLAGTASAIAQTATPSTTVCAAVAVSDKTICLASTTGVVRNTGFYIDLEYMTALATPVSATNAYVPVQRGNQANSSVAQHASGQTVWVALTPDKSVVPGANGFAFGAAFTDYGPCTRSSFAYLPHIWPNRGEMLDCDATTARWTPYEQTFTISVGPGNCAWGTTGTYDAQVAVATGGPNLQGLLPLGASFVPANQIKVTNGGASVNTLTCVVPLNRQPLLNKGVTVKYADVIYGVATTTLTSISGGAFSTITMPTPGATETPSTVTPAAVGGSVTTSATTNNMAATTAGSFYTSRLTPATPINLTGAEQFLLVSENFNQSASAAQVVNTMGMLIHYTVQSR